MDKDGGRAMAISLNGLTLHVADVERSCDFYVHIPGAKLLSYHPSEFALFQIGEGRLGLLKHPKGFHLELNRGFHMEFESPDLDATYREVCEAGFQPESPPQDRPWGQRDFRVLDPDGNLLEFD